MFINPEIKTVMISAEDYCRDYRDPETFIEYCKVCPQYKNLWCCPPLTCDPVEKLKPYKYVYIVGVRTKVDEHLRETITDPVTIGNMTEFITKDCRRHVDGIMLGLEKSAPNSLGFHAGRCYRCQYCARIFGKPCVYPDQMRNSLESYGFDVARTTEELLGFKLEWSADKLPEYISFISALFTKEPIAL
ncbi:MAG: hypothetical protein IJO94_03955 [Firmicutes bacterium]|nr:hypothetical protein [Bacillota bacterium]